MTSDQNFEVQFAEPIPTTPQRRKPAARWYRFVSWLFARKAVSESVATRVHFKVGSEAVWNHVMFYEEVPGRPPFLLRAVLPHPLRAEGDKTRVGATVRCVYRRGDLIKRITSVEPPHFLQFEVLGQHLGIESCLLTLGGSYQICGSGDETDVVLTTNYQAFLRPRYLWRPLEALLVSQLHRHILRGVSSAVRPGTSATRPAAAESITPLCTH
jgi:hypothetical protein